MAITTVTEASAVPTLMYWLADVGRGGLAVPTDEQARQALDTLRAAAYKKLSAGVLASDFDALWAVIVSRVAGGPAADGEVADGTPKVGRCEFDAHPVLEGEQCPMGPHPERKVEQAVHGAAPRRESKPTRPDTGLNRVLAVLFQVIDDEPCGPGEGPGPCEVHGWEGSDLCATAAAHELLNRHEYVPPTRDDG